MLIKTNKGEFKIPNWVLLAGALVVDNMYTNHCKKKALKVLVKAADKNPK